jgi:hypothetical protein
MHRMSSINENLPFESMCVAVERARQVRGQDDGPWSVGVRDAGGALLGHALLDSYAQVKAFARAMEEFGYEHSILGSREDSRCCDFTFRLREELVASIPDLIAA